MCLSYVIIVSADYTVARQKLKLAEQLSDINSCTDEERDEKFKKSRKIRAAKYDSSSYDYDTEKDENDESDEALLLSLPKPPTGKQYTNYKEKSKTKECKAYKGKNAIKYNRIKHF